MKKLVHIVLIFVVCIYAPTSMALTSEEAAQFRKMKFLKQAPNAVDQFRIENDYASNKCESNIVIYASSDAWWVGVLGVNEKFYPAEEFQGDSASMSAYEKLEAGLTTIADLVDVARVGEVDASKPIKVSDLLKYLTLCR